MFVCLCLLPHCCRSAVRTQTSVVSAAELSDSCAVWFQFNSRKTQVQKKKSKLFYCPLASARGSAVLIIWPREPACRLSSIIDGFIDCVLGDSSLCLDKDLLFACRWLCIALDFPHLEFFRKVFGDILFGWFFTTPAIQHRSRTTELQEQINLIIKYQ